MNLEYIFKGLESITDMILVVNGTERIAVNRLLLASVSAYFRNVFTSKIGEGIIKTETSLDDISDMTVLKKLLNSFYMKNTINIILENVDDGDYTVLFLELCDRLGIDIPIKNILHNIEYVEKNYEKLYKLLSEPDGSFVPENFIMFVALGTPRSLLYVPELADELRYKVGHYIVYKTDESIVLYNVEENQEVYSTNIAPDLTNDIIIASPDGMTICSLHEESELHLYKAERDTLRNINSISLYGKIFDACFSAGGNYLAVVGAHAKNNILVTVYEIKEWKTKSTFSFKKRGNHYVIKMNDKDEIIVTGTGETRLYSLDKELPIDRNPEYSCLSPDRQYLFSAEHIPMADYTIHVYNASSKSHTIATYSTPGEVKAIGVGVKFFSYVFLNKVHIVGLTTSFIKIITLPNYVDFVIRDIIKHSSDDKYIYLMYVDEETNSAPPLTIINIDSGEMKQINGVTGFDVFPIF